MIRILAGLLTLAAVCAASAPAAAQAPDGVMSIGSNFVAGACLEARGLDGAVAINKCNATAPQGLTYNDTTGQLVQGDKCLAAPTKGEPLVVVACANVPEQKWNFQDGGIRSDSGVCADVLNFQRELGAAVIAWDCTGTENQKFFVTRVRMGVAPMAVPAAAAQPSAVRISGLPVIASYYVQGKCFSAVRGELRIDNCDRKPNQTFKFAAGASGQIVQDGRCLASDQRGGSIVLAACASTPAQEWQFTADGVLRNRANLCADIINFETSAGARIIAWDCTATDNQKFYPAIAAQSGSFSLGSALAAQLRDNANVTTVSMSPGYSALNITGSGGRNLAVEAGDKIGGGQNDTVVIGGAGVLTVRFLRGLAAPSVKAGAPNDILPRDWSFFGGATAGVITP